MKRTVQFALLAVAVLLAVGITLYPLIANAYTERNRSLIETEYTEAISQMDNTALENAMQAARAYNASLRGVTGMTFSKEAVEYASASYEQLLNVHQDGIMAYVEIPKISVNLPIYHGAGDDSLNRGVGHLLGSALPVGGEATHCILTGHSGLAKDKLFSDLDKLEVGDMFFIHVLNDTLAYRVKELFTVLPEDTSRLMIEGQHDYCTLITCTPLGVNTHRLLVRGPRGACGNDRFADPGYARGLDLAQCLSPRRIPRAACYRHSGDRCSNPARPDPFPPRQNMPPSARQEERPPRSILKHSFWCCS